MKKYSNLLSLVLLWSFTLLGYFLAEGSGPYVMAVILTLAMMKVSVLMFSFMDLKEAHLGWIGGMVLLVAGSLLFWFVGPLSA